MTCGSADQMSVELMESLALAASRVLKQQLAEYHLGLAHMMERKRKEGQAQGLVMCHSL